MYNTIQDAKTAFINSGVVEWIDFDSVDEADVYEWMYRNDKTPEEAAEHFVEP